MTAPELKPCPFCGSGIARTIHNNGFSGVELMVTEPDQPYVWCGTCGASGSFEDDDDKAIAAWNTRADLHDATKAQLEKAVEVLKSLIQHAHNCEKELTEELHHMDFCRESLPLANARAVLAEIEKGEPK